jgi:hypothetical protein
MRVDVRWMYRYEGVEKGKGDEIWGIRWWNF